MGIGGQNAGQSAARASYDPAGGESGTGKRHPFDEVSVMFHRMSTSPER